MYGPIQEALKQKVGDVYVRVLSPAAGAAGRGGRAARGEVQQIVRRITKVETAVEPRFQEHFVAANALPHATAPFPHLAQVAPLPEPSFNAGGSGDGGGRRRRRRG